MTVRALHPEYKAASERWARCRAAADGQDALRAAGQKYLPALIDQTPASYSAYLNRATYFNATWRTIAGLLGMLYRKPEHVEVPAAVKAYLDDVTGNGISLHVLSKDLGEEAFTVGRVGLLVDHPPAPVDGQITLATAAIMGLRPTKKKYPAESITNWRTASINNVHQLVMVTLKESAEIRLNEFESVAEDRWRVLDLVMDSTDATLRYRQRVFRVNKDTDKDEQVGEDVYPLLNGKPLAYIPFWIFGVDKITPAVQIPPMIDLVDINLAHFRASADYEHGCHFTGLPTPVITGYSPADPTDKLYIGSSSAWVFREPTANAFFLEFKGEGLGALEKNLDRKEQQMATIGARLLAPTKRAAETAETAAINANGETSILASVAQTLSTGIEAALSLFCEWAGAAGKVEYRINREFLPVGMDAAMLRELVAAWQAGAMSHESLFDNMQRGELIDHDQTFAKEQAAIDNAPAGAGGLVPAGASVPTGRMPKTQPAAA